MRLNGEFKRIEIEQLYNPHQYSSVPPDQSKTIYKFEVPPEAILFINKIANNWVSDTYWIWKIDGEEVYDKIRRRIGEMEDPEYYSPPFVVEDYVKWIFHNKSDSEVTAEVLCDGFLVRKTGVL